MTCPSGRGCSSPGERKGVGRGCWHRGGRRGVLPERPGMFFARRGKRSVCVCGGHIGMEEGGGSCPRGTTSLVTPVACPPSVPPVHTHQAAPVASPSSPSPSPQCTPTMPLQLRAPCLATSLVSSSSSSVCRTAGGREIGGTSGDQGADRGKGCGRKGRRVLYSWAAPLPLPS